MEDYMKKTILISILLLVAFAFISGTFPAVAAMYNATIISPGVKWPGSAYRASSALKKENGVSEVQADKEKHEVTLIFDSDITSEENIKQRMEKAGFIVEKIEVESR